MAQLVRSLVFLGCSVGLAGGAHPKHEVPDPGTPDYWVYLKGLRSTAGSFDPSFEPNGTKFTLTVEDRHVTRLNLTAYLNLNKYLRDTFPDVYFDGEYRHYDKLTPVTQRYILNETIGPFDKTVLIKLKDPTPVPWWQFWNRHNEHEYQIRIKQQPNFRKVVEAQGIIVRDATGAEVPCDPPFDPKATRDDYHFHVPEGQTDVTVEVKCTEYATDIQIDGKSGVSGPVSIDWGASLSRQVLGQCIYDDRDWTDSMRARVYEIFLERNASMGPASVKLLIVPKDGYCMLIDEHDDTQGFLCRAFVEKPTFVAITNITEAHLKLTYNMPPYNEIIMKHGVPIQIPVSPGIRHPYTFDLRNGRQNIRFPVVMMMPATCDTIRCPSGNALKPDLAQKPNAKDRMCLWEACLASEDVDHCCTDVAMCDTFNFQCPHEQAVRYDSPRIGCDEAICTIQDTGACCRERATCLAFNYTCPEGEALRRDSSVVLCESDLCTEDEGPTCCRERANCSSMTFACPLHTAQVLDSEQVLCKNDLCNVLDDTLTCCHPRQKCSDARFSCPPGLALRHDANVVECKEEVCTATDKLTCCLPQTHCSSFERNGNECPEHQTLRWDADTVRCHCDECTASDAQACCRPKAKCSTYNFSCPVDTGLRHDHTYADCDKEACTEDDSKNCCLPKATCMDYNAACMPHTGLRVDAATIPCEQDVCTQNDRETCCHPVDMCNTFTFNCPEHQALRHNANETECTGDVCSQVDKTVCCLNRALCTSISFACQHPTALRHDANETLCLRDICTEEVDYSTCCTPRVNCSTATCSEHYLLRPDAEETTCESDRCSPEELANCCRRKASCSTFRFPCPALTALRHDATFVDCAGEQCTAVDSEACCTAQAKCASMDPRICPPQSGLRSDASEITCKLDACTFEDVSNCCHDTDMCSNFSFPCPIGKVLRHDAERISCMGVHCDTTDSTRCCVPPANCSSATFSCGPAMTLRRDDVQAKCKTDVCALERDQQACCTARAHCSALGLECPAHTSLRNDANSSFCHGETCSEMDSSSCCKERATCSSFQFNCPEHESLRHDADQVGCSKDVCLEPDSFRCCRPQANCSTFTSCPHRWRLKTNAAALKCKNDVCTTAEDGELCCAPATCDTFFYPCPHGQGLKHDAMSISCQDDPCDESEYATCCVKKAMCSSMVCPGSMVLRNHSDELLCTGDKCTSVDQQNCCTCTSDMCQSTPTAPPHADRKAYFFGTLTKANFGGSYDVHFDWGEVERKVPRWAVRGWFAEFGQAYPSKNLEVGDRVEAAVTQEKALELQRKGIGVLSIGVREKLAHYASVGCSPLPAVQCSVQNSLGPKPTYQDIPHPPAFPEVADNPEKLHLCYYDARCSNYPQPWLGRGCNAGGINANCRFCGFDSYPECPDVYDCNGGGRPALWSPEKQAWCCEHFHTGCPYECRHDGHWSWAKRAWCCIHESIGCSQAQVLSEQLRLRGLQVYQRLGSPVCAALLAGAVAAGLLATLAARRSRRSTQQGPSNRQSLTMYYRYEATQRA